MDDNEKAFIVAVSNSTAIDPRVLAAWIQEEGAYAPNGTGHFNYLNLRDPVSGSFMHFNNVNDAISTTVARLRQPFARPILATAATKPTPRQQIRAIASTGWDSAHYGGTGGPKLVAVFSSLFKGGIDDKYLSPDNASGVASTVGTGSADIPGINIPGSNLPGDVVGAAKGVFSGITSIGDAFKWLGNNWARVLEVLAGFIVVLIGAIMLFQKQTGMKAPGIAALAAKG